MKSFLILGSIALSVANIVPSLKIGVNSGAVLAQTPPATETQSTPLVQAASALLNQERYQLESEMEITGDIPGTFFQSTAQVNTTVEAPNKFNSQITFVSPNGLEGKAYQIVSDGSQVWIYNLATNQYSVNELKQFLQTREGFLIGNLSYFYINTRSNIGSSTIAANFLAKLPEDRLIRYFQRFAQIDLQNSVVKDETIDGTTYKVYDIDASNKGFKVTAYVIPDPANLKQVHLSGTKDGLQLASIERIVNQTIPESIPAETFSFSPPDEAQQLSQQITVTPF